MTDYLGGALRWHNKIERARAIRDRLVLGSYKSGDSVTTIATKLNMSRRGVYDILRRQGVSFLSERKTK